MITSLQIKKIQFYPGIRAGLSNKTAIVQLVYKGDLKISETIRSDLNTYFKALAPADDFYIDMLREWEEHFLLQATKKPDLAHYIAGFATAIQLWARDPVWKGEVLKVTEHSLLLALPWERQDVFKTAFAFVLQFLLLWTGDTQKASNSRQLTARYNSWIIKAQKRGLAPNTLRFALAAMQRSIPLTAQFGQIRLGYGKNSIRMDSSFTGRTSLISTMIAKNKLQTNELLRSMQIPAPVAALAATYEHGMELLKKIPFPVVVKPLNQDQGIGITTNISTMEDFHSAFEMAKKYSPHGVVIERHIEGDDHRMLVVGGRLFMATKRVPGGVTGDGKHTLAQLLEQLNSDPLRGEDKRSLLIRIQIDNEAKALLKEQGLTENSVPPAGRFVKLRHTANLSNGGTAVDVSNIVHPDNRFVVQRAAEVVGLDIAGVDFLCPDISQSWREVGGAIIEINAQPGFRPHWLGAPQRDINGEIVEWLFQDKPARIPTAAITGTNGKTTTAKMLHHIWMAAGKNAGVTTTNGLWVGSQMVSDDNLSGNPGGRIILNDPSVEAAIIEMPRKGLIIFGHPCKQYDVAALLNIQNDHIGADGINSFEEMAALKSEVIERAQKAVVINAEDSLCMQAAQKAHAKHLVLVSTNDRLPLFAAHIEKSGAGVCLKIIENRLWIVFFKNKKVVPLIQVDEIPATMNGLVAFNISNAMFSAGLAWAQELSLEAIRTGLSTFTSSEGMNPGRMNMIEGFPFQLLLDFSHNPDTVKNLVKVVRQMPVKGKKRVLIQNIGNRHRTHFKESASDLAETFDEFIVSCDPKKLKHNLIWGKDDPIGTMLEESRKSLVEEGVNEKAISVEADQEEAIRVSLNTTKAGDLLVLLTEANIAIPVIDAVKHGS